MKIKFWGTRGSIPTPGKETVRYGGNTPCVEVRVKDNKLVILDAGTGIRSLGDRLMESNNVVTASLLIGHPHWDHIQGFPFFKPAFVAGNELTIIGAQSKNVTLRQMISDQMNNVYFPVQLSELAAKINFHPVGEGTTEIPGGILTSIYVNHPQFALGYRIDSGGKSLVYISDNEPFKRDVPATLYNVEKIIVERYSRMPGDPNQRIFDFARGADVLIHDATYTPEEYRERVGWGHSDYLFALKVAAEAQVKKLILFHHDPSHNDEKINRIVETCRREIKRSSYMFECAAAEEGTEIDW